MPKRLTASPSSPARAAPESLAPITRAGCRYAACYCEENIWHLAGDPRLHTDRRTVLFIASHEAVCPFWSQKAAPLGQPLAWDYHVVLALTHAHGPTVYDLDSRLPFPCSLETYLSRTFFLERIKPAFHPRFRAIDANAFRAEFASDRSHMKTEAGFVAPVPPWPPIQTEHETMNLSRYTNMSEPHPGTVLDLPSLPNWLSRLHP